MNTLILTIKFIGAGYGVLLLAIVANYVAKNFGAMTWYELLGQISSKGLLLVLKSLDIKSLLFLFILYPLSLAGAAYLVNKIFKLY